MNRIVQLISLLVLFACCGAGGGCAKLQPVGEFGKNVIDYFSGNTPIRAVARMEDQYFPDERRQGINRLADRDFGRRPPYTDRYAHIAQYDSDYLVRATAIRALNRARAGEHSALFVKALGDGSPLVRQEAAKALANMPDSNAIPALVQIVNNADESRDVRIAAADALKHYRRIDVARALAGTLRGRDFGVSWQARRSLIAMTGQDLRYDESKWLEFLSGPKTPFG
jgi:hypothetical protein